MTTNKFLRWICLFPLIIPWLIWGGTLVKDSLVTVIYKDRIDSIQLAENEERLPEFDWYRITSYSDEEIEIYFVNTVGADTDTQYKIGGKITCTKTTNGWTHTDMINSILWSGVGSADEYVWTYWYHIFLA